MKAFKLAQMKNLLTFVDRLSHAVAIREGELGMKILNKDLARAAEVSDSAVTLWYQGKTEKLKAASLFNLAKYLKVRPEWLWNEEGPMRTNGIGVPQALPAVLVTPDVGLSREAGKLIEMITEADKAHTITKDTLHAFSTILGKTLVQKPAISDLTAAGMRKRMTKIVADHQPKPKKGKGAA